MGSTASKVTNAVINNTVSISYVNWFLLPWVIIAILMYIITIFIFGWPSTRKLIDKNACKNVKSLKKDTYKSGRVEEKVISTVETVPITSPNDIPSTYRKCTSDDFKTQVMIGRIAIIFVPLLLSSIFAGLIYKFAFYAYNPHIAATMFVVGETSDAIRGSTRSSSNSNFGDSIISSETIPISSNSSNSNSFSGGSKKLKIK